MLAAVLMLTASLEGEVEVISGPTISFDWKVGTAFTFNVGISMGYNTVVNDYGDRNKTISVLFGTYF